MVALFDSFLLTCTTWEAVLCFFFWQYSLLLGLLATHFKHCFWICDDSEWTLTKPWGPLSADQLDDIPSEVSGLRNWRQRGWFASMCVNVKVVTDHRLFPGYTSNHKYTNVAFEVGDPDHQVQNSKGWICWSSGQNPGSFEAVEKTTKSGWFPFFLEDTCIDLW